MKFEKKNQNNQEYKMHDIISDIAHNMRDSDQQLNLLFLANPLDLSAIRRTSKERRDPPFHLKRS